MNLTILNVVSVVMFTVQVKNIEPEKNLTFIM